MDFLSSFATAIDRLDPGVVRFLDAFSDERIPFRLSFAIVLAALAILATLVVWGAVAWLRIEGLRRSLRGFGNAKLFARRFAEVDEVLAASIFGQAWRDYRGCLKPSAERVLFPRRPEEYFGLHNLRSASYPARFFAAAHGYFIGIGLLMTFIGLVAALKFAASGVASADPAVAKAALNALLSAASFKFMTSIAGLGCSLLLSVAARSMVYLVEGAAHGLAADLEQNMTPIFSETVAYDQLAATREQLMQLRQLGTTLAAPPAVAAPSANAGLDAQALEGVLTNFAAELRGAAGIEMKQLTTRLAAVGDAIGGMQNHVVNSGQIFADQLNIAASHLLNAAITLQESVDGRVDRIGDRIDALAAIFAKSEELFASSAHHAAQGMAKSIKVAGDEIALGVAQATKSLVATSDHLAQRLSGVLGGFDHFNENMQAQMTSMQAIVGSLDSAKHVLDESAGIWVRSAAPVVASIDASRRVVAEMSQAADRISSTQHDMAAMARSVTELTDKASSVWDNYRHRFEKVDDDLQAVFERLQGGTRAFGKEVMEFVGELDASLAEGMNALSTGTEELRKVAEILVLDVKAKAA